MTTTLVAGPGGTDCPGRSVNDLLAVVGLRSEGAAKWEVPVPSPAPGVYLVALTDDPDRRDAGLPQAPIGERVLRELLDRCSSVCIDGQPAALDGLRSRLAGMWIPCETVLYVGATERPIHQRVREYYRTDICARSPHHGGWPIKTLANLGELFVHWAATTEPKSAESRILDAFVEGVPEATRAGLHDPSLPLPFANLRTGSGRRKKHGITGTTC